jgi:hypothetical protein
MSRVFQNFYMNKWCEVNSAAFVMTQGLQWQQLLLDNNRPIECR